MDAENTSLLNTLEPYLRLRNKAFIQTTGKDQHTATRHELFPLEKGGSIIDTPGVHEFGVC